jgi:hypothetical protein
MSTFERSVLLACALCALALATPAAARDVDGPDCGFTRIDYGDAPEGVFAYPGVPGRFPTCTLSALPSSWDVACPPISTPPGPSGFVTHFLGGANFWLGCYGPPAALFSGIDTDPDGKTNQPAVGFSACGPFPTDCVEAAFGLTFDQDECYADGSDAGVVSPPSLVVCKLGSVSFNTMNCQPFIRQAFLNILVDFNHDGDWNDNEICPASGACAYEWAIKNEVISIFPGCAANVSPAFFVGPRPGPSWMRITISEDAVGDDFPWFGATGLHNGETEDYPVDIQIETPAAPSSWGQVKAIYRN